MIRPLVLFADRTATQRARETATHPDTVRTLHRRFRQQGMLGLLPGDVEVGRRERPGPDPRLMSGRRLTASKPSIVAFIIGN